MYSSRDRMNLKVFAVGPVPTPRHEKENGDQILPRGPEGYRHA